MPCNSCRRLGDEKNILIRSEIEPILLGHPVRNQVTLLMCCASFLLQSLTLSCEQTFLESHVSFMVCVVRNSDRLLSVALQRKDTYIS